MRAPGPVRNAVLTPLAGAQWRQSGGQYPFEPVIVSNVAAPDVPLGDDVQPVS